MLKIPHIFGKWLVARADDYEARKLGRWRPVRTSTEKTASNTLISLSFMFLLKWKTIENQKICGKSFKQSDKEVTGKVVPRQELISAHYHQCNLWESMAMTLTALRVKMKVLLMAENQKKLLPVLIKPSKLSLRWTVKFKLMFHLPLRTTALKNQTDRGCWLSMTRGSLGRARGNFHAPAISILYNHYHNMPTFSEAIINNTFSFFNATIKEMIQHLIALRYSHPTNAKTRG